MKKIKGGGKYASEEKKGQKREIMRKKLIND